MFDGWPHEDQREGNLQQVLLIFLPFCCIFSLFERQSKKDRESMKIYIYMEVRRIWGESRRMRSSGLIANVLSYTVVLGYSVQ